MTSPSLIAFLPTSTFRPALSPPPGVIPTYTHSTDYYVIGEATTIVACILTTISVGWRVIAKLFIIKKHGLEDYFMYAAWAFTMAYFASGDLAQKSGGGTHQWNLSSEEQVRFLRYSFICELLYEPIILFAKVSILLQIQRIFVITDNLRFYLVRGLIWITVVYYIINLFLAIFQCVPLAKIFNRLAPGTCFDNDANLIAVAIFAVLSDFAILLLPVIWIWRSQMSIKRRLGVSTIFAVALIGCVTSIVRLFYSILNYRTNDMSFGLYRIGLTSAGEYCAAIVAGNMVLLPCCFSLARKKIITAIDKLSSLRKKSPISDPTCTPSPKSVFLRRRHADLESLPADSVELREPIQTRRNNYER